MGRKYSGDIKEGTRDSAKLNGRSGNIELPELQKFY